MSRVLLLSMDQAHATSECEKMKVGISSLEDLASGGVRLVCMSSDGAETARKKLKSKLITGDVIRTRHRPTRPMW